MRRQLHWKKEKSTWKGIVVSNYCNWTQSAQDLRRLPVPLLLLLPVHSCRLLHLLPENLGPGNDRSLVRVGLLHRPSLVTDFVGVFFHSAKCIAHRHRLVVKVVAALLRHAKEKHV